MNRTLAPIALCLTLLMTGCATLRRPADAPTGPTTPAPPATQSEPADAGLIAGPHLFENGDYAGAARALGSALARGGGTPAERVRGYKYLAFSECVLGHKAACREAFRNAFMVDPEFALERAEVGHPMWGPVYREVKKEMAGR